MRTRCHSCRPCQAESRAAAQARAHARTHTARPRYRHCSTSHSAAATGQAGGRAFLTHRCLGHAHKHTRTLRQLLLQAGGGGSHTSMRATPRRARTHMHMQSNARAQGRSHKQGKRASKARSSNARGFGGWRGSTGARSTPRTQHRATRLLCRACGQNAHAHGQMMVHTARPPEKRHTGSCLRQ